VLIIIRLRDDVVRRRGYSDHFVMMLVHKTKTPDQSDLKIGTVVLDSLLMPTDFE